MNELHNLAITVIGNLFDPVLFVVSCVIFFAPGVLKALDYLRRQKPDPEFQKWLESLPPA